MHPGIIAAGQPQKPAVVMASTGTIQTFAELDASANRLSQMLRSRGFMPGDHIAICLENHPRYLEVLWGCHYAGLVYTPCSSRLTSRELQYIINDCGAKAFITSLQLSDQAAGVLPSASEVDIRLMLDGTIDGFEAFEAAVDGHPATPLDNRVAGGDMLYSSGTTGQPKGVVHPFAAAPLDKAGGARVRMLTSLFDFTPEAVYLSPAPLYHSAPLRFCLTVHALGGTVVVMDHFDPEQFLETVERYRVSHTQVVPTMLVRMLKLPDHVRTKYDLSTLTSVVHGAAPCPAPVKKQVIEWLGPIVHEYYGGTEGNGFVYCSSRMWLDHEGSVGKAIDGTLHIVGDDGQEVPIGESGAIYFEGGGQFEYHNDPQKTMGSRHPRGWSTIGDVGYLDDDGYLYLTDRKAYMIITGGVNVYPQEAENVLITHPKVLDVAVFGVPNEDFGEEVKAVVQATAPPGDEDEATALAEELIAYCREQLAAVKCPRSIDFRDELPRHPTGKLYKRLLKDEYWQHSGRAI